MAAVVIHNYSIDPSLDITGKTALEIEAIWKQQSNWPGRAEFWNEMILNGELDGNNFYSVVDVENRTMERGVQFIDVVAAQKWLDFIVVQEGQQVGAFTCIDRIVEPNTTIPRRGRYLAGE